MPRTFTEKITLDQLAEKIWDAWQNSGDYQEAREDAEIQPSATARDKVINWRSNIYYNRISPQIEDDLKKVQFDTENISADPDNFGGEGVGLHTLENGLSYLGVSAGGDWEFPIFFAIYWDGAKLRGYIPKEGNPWNTDTKMAYGNDEESDEKNLKKRGYDDRHSADFDHNEIRQDMLDRIKFKG